MKKLVPICLLLLWACHSFAQVYIQGNTTRYVCNGTFYDGGYNGNYNNSEYSVQTFRGFGGANISVTFSAFFTEFYKDFLLIYDGPDIHSPLIGTYTGNNSPGTVTSTSGCLTFEFISDFSNNYPGWTANISCINNSCLPNMANCQDLVCASPFFDSGGNFGNYGNNENLTHTLLSSNGTCLTVTFWSFFLEPGRDFLRIYDGPDATAPLIGTFTGNNSPGILSSSSGALTFVFTSDGQNPYPGWSASVNCTACPPVSGNPFPPCLPNMGNCIDTACGGNFYDSGGLIGNYGNNEGFKHTIFADAGSCLSVNFTAFNVEPGSDFLAIYDGPSTAFPLIGIYTGSISPGNITSTMGALTFTFTSNSVGTRSGWAADISCLSNSLGTPLGTNFYGKNFDSYVGSSAVPNLQLDPMTFLNQSSSLPSSCTNQYTRRFRIQLANNPNSLLDSVEVSKVTLLLTRAIPYAATIQLHCAGAPFQPIHYQPGGPTSPYKIEADFSTNQVIRKWNPGTLLPYEILTAEITPNPSVSPNFDPIVWNGFANRVEIMHGIIIVDNLDSVLDLEANGEDDIEEGEELEMPGTEASFILFPNPASGLLYLQGFSDLESSFGGLNREELDRSQVMLYDAAGKQISLPMELLQTSGGLKMRFDIHSISPGIYQVKVITPEGTVRTKRFVKY